MIISRRSVRMLALPTPDYSTNWRPSRSPFTILRRKPTSDMRLLQF